MNDLLINHNQKIIPTYTTDDARFTIIVPQMCVYYAWPLYKWLINHQISPRRLIQDYEIEDSRLSLKEVHKIYPEIATIGIVMNPWARFILKFKNILAADNDTLPELAREFKITFETGKVTNIVNKCVKDINANGSKTGYYGYHALTPQMEWLSYMSSTGYQQANYIIRGEYVHNDMSPLTDYFCLSNATPFNFDIAETEYRSYYSDETKNLIAELYHIDINTFKYNF